MQAPARRRLPAANARVAQAFDDIADLLEMQGANPFRVRAYREAGRDLRSFSRDVAEMVASGEDLTALRGIGKDLAQKIAEIVTTGRSTALDELHASLPASLHEVLHVPGLGPARVRLLHERLGVRSAADLAAAAQAGRVRELPGFGEKSERKILDALAGALGTARRMSLHAARREATRLVGLLEAVEGVTAAVAAGSYRRGRATVGDLDVLVTTRSGRAAIEALVGHEQVARVVARGEGKVTVMLRSGLQVDLRVVPPASFGAALHYFTGSRAHNIAVRAIARRHGLKINEYGVFEGERLVAGRTEASVFGAVGLPEIPAEIRENRGEIEAARAGTLPRLLELSDLRGDLVILDGPEVTAARIDAVLAVAVGRGHAWISIVHASPFDDPDDLVERMRKVTALASSSGIEVHQGVEVAPDTELPDAARARAEIVIARLVLHGESRSPSPAVLRRLAALHPDGIRVVLEDADPAREPSGDLGQIVAPALVDARRLVVTGAESSLPLAEPLLRWAKREGKPFVVATGDPAAGLEALELAVIQARRAWIEPRDALGAGTWASVWGR